MKKRVAAVLLSTAVLASACSAKSEVILTSDAGKITKEEFYQELKNYYGAGLLNEMAGEMLLLDKYPISDKEIDAEFDKFKEELGGNKGLSNYLEEYQLTEKELKENMEYNLAHKKALVEDAGMTDEALEEFLQKNEKLLNQVDASHILVETKEEAQDILEELKEGMSFEEAAKEHSKDSSASTGGNIGFFSKGEMVPAFEEAAFKLKKDEVSEPVQSNYGFHIIKVNDTRVLNLKDYKEEVERLFLAEHGNLSQTFINKLFSDNNVEVFLDEDKK